VTAIRLFIPLLLAGMVTGCGGVEREMPPYATNGSQLPNLDSTLDGGVVLSWVEPDGEGHRLRFASYEEGEWSEPHTISSGDDSRRSASSTISSGWRTGWSGVD
jgi:hypothetical protein